LDTAFAVTPEALAAAANLRADAVRRLLGTQPGLRPLPDATRPEAYTTGEKWERLRAALGAALASFHRQHPRQPGMEMESLRSQLAADLPPKVFRAVIEHLAAAGDLVRAESLVRLPAHATGLGRDDA